MLAGMMIAEMHHLGISKNLQRVSNSAMVDLNVQVPAGDQDTAVLAIARMLAANKTLRELGLSKLKLADSHFATLVRHEWDLL
jgi:hypothetical protein